MCRASLCWSRPVCAGSPASQFLRHEVELVRMSGDSGVGSGVLMLEWRSLGGEEVALPGSTAGSCKEAGSGRSFYSGCCGLFVPDDLTAFMTHHVAAPHALPPYWWGSVRLQVGVADLTCARSVVRHLVPFVHPVDRSRWFGHVSGLAVRSGRKGRGGRWGRRFGVRIDDVRPTKGAINVIPEPGIDAGNVERVAALGEQTDQLPVAELAEADGAVGGTVEEAIARLVLRHRDGTNDGLVKPDSPDIPHMVERLPLVKRRSVVVFWAPTRCCGTEGAAPSAEDSVVGEEEKDAGEDGSRDQYDVGEGEPRVFVARERRRRRRVVVLGEDPMVGSHREANLGVIGRRRISEGRRRSNRLPSARGGEGGEATEVVGFASGKSTERGSSPHNDASCDGLALPVSCGGCDNWVTLARGGRGEGRWGVNGPILLTKFLDSPA
ncbi:hypothetical protein BHM03_00038686 [Ensete ventricosum]|nr:hypothetical protein BHM03_00038686 [Ensete ventricosum]